MLLLRLFLVMLVVQGSLGAFGGLRLVEQKEKAPTLFGAEVPLEPGEGR